MEIAIANNIHNLIVYGDSLIFIRQTAQASDWIISSPLPMAQRAISVTSQFENIKFYHILRHLNKEEDELAKTDSNLTQANIVMDNCE